MYSFLLPDSYTDRRGQGYLCYGFDHWYGKVCRQNSSGTSYLWRSHTRVAHSCDLNIKTIIYIYTWLLNTQPHFLVYIRHKSHLPLLLAEREKNIVIYTRKETFILVNFLLQLPQLIWFIYNNHKNKNLQVGTFDQHRIFNCWVDPPPLFFPEISCLALWHCHINGSQWSEAEVFSHLRTYIWGIWHRDDIYDSVPLTPIKCNSNFYSYSAHYLPCGYPTEIGIHDLILQSEWLQKCAVGVIYLICC